VLEGKVGEVTEGEATGIVMDGNNNKTEPYSRCTGHRVVGGVESEEEEQRKDFLTTETTTMTRRGAYESYRRGGSNGTARVRKR